MRLSGIVAAVVGVVLFVGLLVIGPQFIAGWKSTPVDKIGLHYTGGPFQGTKYVGIIQPGSGKKFLGLQDSLHLLPVNQRDYTACDELNGDKKPLCDGPSIVAPAKGGVEMRFSIGAYFTLNTSNDVVRKFYERVCVKFDCTSDGGWGQMLLIDFRRPIEQSIQASIRNFSVDELYAGVPSVDSNTTGAQATAVLTQVQDQIAKDLKNNINAILGGDYFCGPTFNRNDPTNCPDFQFQITAAVPTAQSVIDSFSQNAASKQAVVTATNNAAAKVAEAQGQQQAQQALQGLYTDPQYIAYLNALALQSCAGNSNCTLVVTQGGTGVNVSTGTKPAGS